MSVINKAIKWLDNFWYHYKWHVIIFLFVAVFLVVSITQMAKKEKVDAYVMYAGPVALNVTELESLQDAFASIMSDVNGDGKKVVQLIDVTYLTDSKIEENKKMAEADGVEYNPDLEFIQNMRQKYKLQLAAGDAYLVLVDPEVFEEDYPVGVFEKLDTLKGFDSSTVNSEDYYNDSAINFKSLDFGKYFEVFDKLPDDTLLCIRKMGVTAQSRGKKEQNKFNAQLELLNDIVEFKSATN